MELIYDGSMDSRLFKDVLGKTIREMTVVMEEDRMLGVVSDGDIRRAIERVQREGANPLDLRARQMMTATPVTIDAELLAIEAARLCEHRKITFLVVEAPGSPRPVGVLHIHDLLTAKVI